MSGSTDRDKGLGGAEIRDRSICEQELAFTNTPTDGQHIQINMPSGTFTAVDAPEGANGSTFLQSFVNGDLTTDKITITHNLSTSYPVVEVYDNIKNIILPTEITYVTDNSIELDFSGMTPLTGTYNVRVVGSGGSTGAFRQTFTDADLTAGVLTANHNLDNKYVLVRIYDNNDNIIEPDEFTATDTNNLTVDLTSFGTLPGSWNIVISVGGISTSPNTQTSVKSYTFSGGGLVADKYYLAGFYDAPTADANLTQASTTVVHGTANVAYGSHAFLVAGGAGSASGGAGTVEIEISGTSITDAGVRTPSDTEIVVADITTLSLNDYFETSKKWIGAVTYTLKNSSGSTHTTFSLDFNYGYVKYEDLGNRDFTIVDFEAIGVAGANDTDFNIRLIKHSSTGWTYHATVFVPGNGSIVDMSTDYSTENDLSNGEPFAYKRAGLSSLINGNDSEGIIIEITTGNTSAVRTMDAHIGIIISA